jgi:hypothetical protein
MKMKGEKQMSETIYSLIDSLEVGLFIAFIFSVIIHRDKRNHKKITELMRKMFDKKG